MKIDNVTKFSESYFLSEINSFRQMCGQKDFWAKSADIREAALKGLGFVWMNVYPDDGSELTREQIEKYSMIYYDAINNYQTREIYYLMNC